MHATANSPSIASPTAVRVAVDLAKNVFELAFADIAVRMRAQATESSRLRPLPHNSPSLRIVMEACGSAHFWARRLQCIGHTVALLPAHDVRPYVCRNKIDRTDAAGLLEVDRRGELRPVTIKSPEAQDIQAPHRIRDQLKTLRMALINLIRFLLREFGLVITCSPWPHLRSAPA